MTGRLGNELEGYTIVALEQAVAAPYCGLLLAHSGARVIKVERPGGDAARAYDNVAAGHSAYFVWLNGGKQSVVLDLDTPEDEAIMRRMLSRADVFLHNLAPGSMERRGFGGAELRRTNPGLVCCEITGYGRTGPFAEMKAYDLLVQAETGLCWITGGPEGPARVGVSLCDIATGLTAFSAILRALLLRGRTGQGIDLSISMFDVLADWMNVPLLFQSHLGKAPSRLGVRHPSLAPYGLYDAKDGEPLLVAIQNNVEWARLCREVLGRPDFVQDARFAANMDRVANSPALDAEIASVFARFSRDELIAKLNEARIACARLNDVAGLLAHPHLRMRGTTMDGVEVRLADLPVPGRATPGGRAPMLDEHGSDIRREFAVEMAASG